MKNKRIAWTIIAISLIALLPFIVNALFVYPCVDDYAHAFRFFDATVYEVFREVYLKWSGRYFATFISLSNPLLLKCVGLSAVYSIILLCASYIAIYYAIRKLCGNELSKLSSFALTGLVMTCFLSSIPAVFEFYYWFSGYITYTVATILQIVFLGMCVHFARTQRKPISFLTIAIILLFIIAGSNEFSIIQMHALTVIGIISIPQLRKNKYVYILYAALLLFTAFFASAPGNYVRLEICDANITIGRALLLALYYSVKSLWHNAGIYCISGTLYLCFFAQQISDRCTRILKIHPVIFTALCMATFVFLQFFSFYATLSPLLYHTENGTFLLSFLVWFCIIQLWYNFYKHKYEKLKLFNNRYVKIISVLALVVYISMPQSVIAVACKDIITKQSVTYHKQRVEHTRILENSKNTQKVSLTPLYTYPETILPKRRPNYPDITNTLYIWANPFYGIDTISIENDTLLPHKTFHHWDFYR